MKILSFGEILFDVFGDTEKLGGAPLNFLADMVALGAEGYMLSAISSDRYGQNAIAFLENAGIDYSFTNTGSLFGTGICNVTLGEDNEPVYSLPEGVAYDHITLSPEDIERINALDFDVLYFGTLAQRNISSRATLDKLLNECHFGKVFFDINLRQSFYSNEVIKAGLERADILKINHSECGVLCDMGFCMNRFGEKHDDEALLSLCRELCESYSIETVIITLGAEGSCVYKHDTEEFVRSEAAENKVVSTVGAGDAYSACFVYNYINGKPLPVCVDRANALGDFTVGFLEAIPTLDDEFKRSITE